MPPFADRTAPTLALPRERGRGLIRHFRSLAVLAYTLGLVACAAEQPRAERMPAATHCCAEACAPQDFWGLSFWEHNEAVLAAANADETLDACAQAV